MNFELTSEEKLVRDTAREFAEKELKPIAADIDKNHKIPDEIIKKLAELGFFGVYIPEEYGGAGLSFTSYILIIEEISKVCASTGVMLSVHNSLTCNSIYMLGSEEQKKKYLPKLTSGEKIGCFMLTEPEAGSDAASLSSNVKKQDDCYIINGSKIFVTNGGYRGYGILFATHNKSLRHRGISSFILDLELDGVNLLRNEEKMGLRGTCTSAFSLENVRIDKKDLLAEEGRGFKVAMDLLDSGRVSIAAQALGMAEGAFERAVEYSKERKQFGKTIHSFQAIQFKLADMAMRVESARLMTYRAASMKDAHQNPILEASMAKTYASEAATYVAKEAIQIYGGYGYITEYEVERMYRDARITEIYEGSNEIQRVVISRILLK